MKKIIAIMLIILLQVSIVLGYTVKVRVREMDLVITGEEGNEMKLYKQDPAIVNWKVLRGNTTVDSEGKFTVPAEDVEIEAILQYTVTLDQQRATTAGTTSVVATYKEAMPAITAPKRVYTVNYNYNGGTGSPPSATTEFTFNGYFKGTNGSGKQYYKADSSSANVWDGRNDTIYADWIPTSVTLPTPARAGYRFKGWYKDSGLTQSAGAAGASFTPEENDDDNTITLYAKWEANEYTVKYNGNGATGGSTADSSHTYDVAKNLTANGFVNVYTVNYNANGGTVSPTSATATSNFTGWAKTASGAAELSDQQSVINLTSEHNATVNLYAKWGPRNTVTLPTPTRTGYAFLGWGTSSTGTPAYVGGQTINVSSNMTLYALWQEAPYTITTIEPEGVEIEGEYTNHRCSTCGGKDHECEVLNIIIEAGNAEVIEDLTKTTGSPYTIITTAPEGVEIEGEYQNHSCSTCGGKDHECQVVNIMIEEGNSVVELINEQSDTPYTITTIAPEGYTIEGEYTNHRCSSCGGTDHEKCETVEIIIDAGNAIVQEI